MKVLAALLSSVLLTGSWPSPGPGRAAPGSSGGATLVNSCTITETDDAGSCSLGTVSVGDVIICMAASELDQITWNITSSGTATLSAWSNECSVTAASHGAVRISAATITGAGTITPAYDGSGTPATSSSGFCAAYSGVSDVIGFASDSDNDSPQAETLTVTANNSWIFGVLDDWNAVAGCTLRAGHALLHSHDDTPGSYMSCFYRSSTVVSSGSSTWGFDTHASTGVGHCAAEVLD